MPKKTAAEAAAKWGKNLRGSVSEIQAGVDRVTQSPGVSAAAQKDKWVAKMSSPETQNKWERNTRAVDLSTWKTITKSKVASNLSSGVTAAEPKMNARYADMFPYMQSLEDRIKGMPDVTLGDSVARATAWIEGMAAYKGR